MKSRIRIFNNRIEFLNAGALPQDLEMIRSGDMSLPRNPILAKLFYASWWARWIMKDIQHNILQVIKKRSES